MLRDRRQVCVERWVKSRFGEHCQVDTRERVMRVLEEAIELAQAEGISRDEVNHLLNHVFNKPVGDFRQEVGGIQICLLAYCANKGISADAEELRELTRIYRIPIDEFQRRQNVKAQAGIGVSV